VGKFEIFVKVLVKDIKIYTFAPLKGGDVAQVVEHRTENP
jgi:hypothetical protein